ncbi:MAG TPA: hypothetical protein VN636_13385 [Acidimicrobiia bacterium]|nr:hypothetical protein [Acidimicrobiia bacterium]
MDEEQGSGWLTFAAIVLMFAGVMKLFDSIWAFRAKNTFANLPNATLGSTLKNYGWYWLILGILLIMAGFGVLNRSQLARWFGIVVVAVAGIASMAWMPYYPIWALTYVAIAILVIYGLAAHGGLEIPGTPSSS